MLSLSYCMIFFLLDFILMKLSLLTRFRLALKAFKNLFIFKLRKVKISPVLRSRNSHQSMHDHKLLKALNWAFGIELILRQNGRSLAKFYVWEVKKLDEIKVHRTPLEPLKDKISFWILIFVTVFMNMWIYTWIGDFEFVTIVKGVKASVRESSPSLCIGCPLPHLH